MWRLIFTVKGAVTSRLSGSYCFAIELGNFTCKLHKHRKLRLKRMCLPSRNVTNKQNELWKTIGKQVFKTYNCNPPSNLNIRGPICDCFVICTFFNVLGGKFEGFSRRVLKCDVIKWNFWNYGICQDILKEQCPRGLLTKNEHFEANSLWDVNRLY